jgi:hypothetical protein
MRHDLHNGWLVLGGSTDPWTVVRQLADENAGGHVVLFLKSERQPGIQP